MEAYFEGISPYNVTTFYYYPEVTVTVVTEGEKGTVSQDYFKVAYGTVLSTAGDTLTVGDYGVSIATPAPADAQYTYEFINFTEGDTVNVIAGVWKDTVGVVQRMDMGKQTATIMVELFGRETPVEISFDEINKSNY